MPGIYFSFKSNVKNLLECISFPHFTDQKTEADKGWKRHS